MTDDDTARSRRARIAALTRVSREPSGTAMTAPARSAFLAKFYADTPAHLPEAERDRMARAALRAHMIRLSHNAAEARTAAARAHAAAVEAEAAELAASRAHAV